MDARSATDTPHATPDIRAHLDAQIRVQERQLVAVRLAVVVLATGFFLAFGERIAGLPLLYATLAFVAVYSLVLPLLLLTPIPARAVGLLGTFLDMVAVSAAVWVGSNLPDAYLFYALVILGTGLRFGLSAAILAGLVTSVMYLTVIVLATPQGAPVRELVPFRMLYIVTFGVVAGLFSRIVMGRAEDTARLQQRLAAEEVERERGRERELLARLGREFGASLDRQATQRAIVSGSATLLGDATMLFVVDPAEPRLVPVAADGHDPDLAARWHAIAAARPPRFGEGVIGSVAAGSIPRFGSAVETTAQAAAGTHQAANGGEGGGNGGERASDAEWLSRLAVEWVVAAPIFAGGRLLGVLATVGRAGRSADERTRRLIETFADRAGPALQNAQLWSDLQERMVREEQARRVKDDFLSVVSHELRTPLTSIQGYSQLLEARLSGERPGGTERSERGGRTERGGGVEHAGSAGDGAARDAGTKGGGAPTRAGKSALRKELAHLRVIRSQVGRMRRLVDDLLDVSRIDRMGGVGIEPVDFDLAAELRDAVNRTRRADPERHVALQAPDSIRVHLDRDRIGQVISNLLENAVKYSPDGGPIDVRARLEGEEVEVLVTDTGIGISPEHRENVFERFYQADDDAARRRFGGLGLGLAISRAIVEAHGGRIWAAGNEEAGRGSVFGFRVARTAEATPPRQFVDTDEPPSFVVRRRRES